MVNIPAYSLVYYQNGNQVLASRVIVGRPDRKTPMMSSALNNVVVNPRGTFRRRWRVKTFCLNCGVTRDTLNVMAIP